MASGGGPPAMPSSAPSPRSAGGSGGAGFTMPAIERLDVVFDAKAAFTTSLLHQSADKSRWEPVH